MDSHLNPEDPSFMEAPLLSLTGKSLSEMTDAELEEFHKKIRNCTTNHQTFLAEIRTKSPAKEAKADKVKVAPSGSQYE